MPLDSIWKTQKAPSRSSVQDRAFGFCLPASPFFFADQVKEVRRTDYSRHDAHRTSSGGSSHLPSPSAATSKMAPSRAATGSSQMCLPPTSLLAMCGASKQTNPLEPTTATQAPPAPQTSSATTRAVLSHSRPAFPLPHPPAPKYRADKRAGRRRQPGRYSGNMFPPSAPQASRQPKQCHIDVSGIFDHEVLNARLQNHSDGDLHQGERRGLHTLFHRVQVQNNCDNSRPGCQVNF